LIERGWTQGAIARDAIGFSVPSLGHDAARWCTVGAISRAAPDGCDVYWVALDLLRNVVGTSAIEIWNDQPTRTKEDVLAAFDKAIALAEGES
jgi:hypothetical protein